MDKTHSQKGVRRHEYVLLLPLKTQICTQCYTDIFLFSNFKHELTRRVWENELNAMI